MILTLVGAGLTPRGFGLALLAPIAVWLTTIFSTRRQYVDQFRSRLQQGVIDTRLELQELDLHSLEALISALNSESDEEVMAAVDVFDTHGREDLIPVLVLYHPSKEVRIRALEAFAEASDKRFVPVARRMLNDEDPDIQAAALRALTAVSPDRFLLEEKLDLDASIVKATALVGLLAAHPESNADRLQQWIGSGNARTQSSLARAIRHERGVVFHDALIELIQTDDDEVRLETLRAMEKNPDPRYLPHLLPLLGSSDLRESTRQALVAIGREALDFLDAALEDESTPRKIRRRIPHSVIRFDAREAAPILMRHLKRESQAGVRFKIIRALSRLRVEHPSVPIDATLLDEQLRSHLLRTSQVLQWRAAIEREASDPEEADLLLVALRDKEREVMERAFWLMGLRHPQENLVLVWRGLRSDNARLRAASLEVLEATLTGPIREATLTIVDDGQPPDVRAGEASSALGAPLTSISAARAVDAMMADQSEVIRGIAGHYAATLSRQSSPGPFGAPEEVPGLAEAVKRGRMDRFQRFLFLRTLPGLLDVPAEVSEVIAANTRERFYPKGEHLYRSGVPALEVQYVVSGECEIIRNGVAVRRFGPRSVIGGVLALAEEEKGYDCIALTDMVTLAISSDDSQEIFEEHFVFLKRVIRVTSGEVLAARRQLGPTAGFGEVAEPFPVPNRPFDLVERMDFIRKAYSFEGSEIEAIADLAREVQEVHLPRGEVLGRSGIAVRTSCCLFAVWWIAVRRNPSSAFDWDLATRSVRSTRWPTSGAGFGRSSRSTSSRFESMWT